MPGVLSTPESFWSKVDIRGPDECWPWKQSLNISGYGNVYYRGWKTNAHRVAYFLTFGEVDKLKVICHRCDNPACCNPAHLWEGTQGENVRDCNLKGRGKGKFSDCSGANHPRYSAKLTSKDVEEARDLYWSKQMSQTQLGKKYGVHSATISRIVRGESWNHIPLENKYAIKE